MRKLLGALLGLIVILPVAALALLWFGVLAGAPAVRSAPADGAALDALHQELRETVQVDDGLAHLTLSETDANRLVGHVLRQQGWPGAARVGLHDATIEAELSIDTGLPRPWLNIEMRLRQQGQELHLAAARAGNVPVPAALLPPLEAWGRERLHRHSAWPDVARTLATVKRWRVAPNRIEASLALQDAARQALPAGQGELIFGPAVQQRSHAYEQAFQQVLAGRDRAPLPAILSELASYAQTAIAGGADPLTETRAMLLALTLHSIPPPLRNTFQGANAKPRAPSPVKLTLHRRYDLAQHFLVSALMASYGDQTLAGRAGLYKELRDRTHGSGFDPTDLLADYAGMTFGALAAAEPAPLLQRLLPVIDDGALMPPPGQLPARAVAALQVSAGSGDLAALQQQADRHLLPLLVPLPLYAMSR